MSSAARPHPVDLALGEVSPAAMHDALVADPMLAVEVAEVRELLARFEPIGCEVSPRFRRLMAGVEGRAAARIVHTVPSGRAWPWLAAAAVLAIVALRAWHPLATAHGVGGKSNTVAGALAGGAALPRPAVSEAVRFVAPQPEAAPAQDPFLAVESRLANEGAGRLLENLASSASFPAPRPLQAWVAPGNLMALQRLDRELLASAELRRGALARVGANPDMDDRVQQLAGDVAAALEPELAAEFPSVAGVAAAVRGLLHSGSSSPGAAHAEVLGRAGAWMLVRAESGTCGSDLPLVLEALLEHAAVTGDALARVRSVVNGFVSGQLAAGRGRPLLADWKTTPAALAAAGRMLQAAPGFGADPMACHVLRRLAWSHLREREAVLGSQPALLAAMTYGYADFAEAGDARLQGYRLASFLPDLAAVQNVAWGCSDGARGSTRVRMDLRRMAALPTPAPLLDRGNLLVALTAEYVHAGASLRRLASG